MPNFSKLSGFQGALSNPLKTTLVKPTLDTPKVKKTTASELSPKDAQKMTPLAASKFEPKTENILSTNKPLAEASKEQVKKAMDAAVSDNYRTVPPRASENRHELNQRLQLKDPNRAHGPSNPIHYDGSDVVVISFEGTGAFEPRRLEIMKQAAENLQKQGLKSDGLVAPATEGIEARNGKKANWSGLNVGVHTAILKDPELQNRTQILSFPSEESELFKGAEVQDTFGGSYIVDALKDFKSPMQKIKSEIGGSLKGNTPGINNALIAMRDIQAQAKAQGKSPKFVIVGHSSGGRSMVKFLEKAKAIKGTDGQPVKFDLAVSIDPVREAHEAAVEGLQELINKGTEHNGNRLIKTFNFFSPVDIKEKKVYPPVVGYDSQPESLYAPSNVTKGKYLSFYQRADSEGLGMGFGIHGSKVAGAVNTQIFNNKYNKPLGKQGHGEITYNPKVVGTFTDGIKGLLRLP